MTGLRVRRSPILPGMKVRVAELDNIVLHFDISSQARRVSARWRGGMLRVITPPGNDLESVVTWLISVRDKILSGRPAVTFYEGQVMEFDGFCVTIRRQSLCPRKLTLTGEHLAPVISVGSDLDFEKDDIAALISRLMCVAAKAMAPTILLPHAAGIAESLGLRPKGWKVSSGHRTLGTCHRDGTISLSAVVLFLPTELRDYIICHELAHLSHMNHSPQFHALCDSYLGGRERELIRKLKNFNWPILKL